MIEMERRSKKTAFTKPPLTEVSADNVQKDIQKDTPGKNNSGLSLLK